LVGIVKRWLGFAGRFRRSRVPAGGGEGPFWHRLLPKKTRYVGVDLGAEYIKVAEVHLVKGRPQVVSLISCPTPEGAVGETLDEERLLPVLAEFVEQNGLSRREVITAVAGSQVITRHVRLAPVPSRQLEAAVREEAARQIPKSLEELVLRHVLLGTEEGPAGRRWHVLLVAAPTALVQQYYEVLMQAGLVVAAVDLQLLALWRTYLGVAPAAHEGAWAVVDVGATTTHLAVIDGRELKFSRTLAMGAQVAYAAVAGQYGLEPGAAREMVVREGNLSLESDSQLCFVLRESLAEFTRELRRSLDFYHSQEQARPVERVILSGGASRLEGFDAFVGEALGVPVEVAAPAVEFGPDLAWDPRYAVAAGLALREAVA